MEQCATESYSCETSGQPSVSGILHRPANPSGDGIVLTHGAGANADSPLLVGLAEAFAKSGFLVLRCNLPFRQMRPHGPPHRGSSSRDQQGIRSALLSLKELVPKRLFVGGHSYGGRQASMLAATEPSLVPGLLLLSYPLHPPKGPSVTRTGHFEHLVTPTLFVHGDRDPFGSLQDMQSAMRGIPARTELLPILDAGHSLLTKRNRGQLPELVLRAMVSFFNCGPR